MFSRIACENLHSFLLPGGAPGRAVGAWSIRDHELLCSLRDPAQDRVEEGWHFPQLGVGRPPPAAARWIFIN